MELGSEHHLSLSQLQIAERNLFDYLRDYTCIYTDSGRSAIQLAADVPGTVLLPEFVCSAVTDCFDAERLRFYRIGADGRIDLPDLLEKVDSHTGAIFLMHYFGAVQPMETLRQIRQTADDRGLVILEDTTHSLLSQRQTVGDYLFASIRKWLPIPLGGVLYSRKPLPDPDNLPKSTGNERTCGMILKDLFLRGQLDCNAEYREIFSRCEERLDEKQSPERISDFAAFLVSCFDIPSIRRRRTENYRYLARNLRQLGIVPAIPLGEDDCPFVLPVRVKERDAFRRYLMERNIYCAVHWPFVPCGEGERPMAKYNAETLLSLPIDQRYGTAELDYLTEQIAGYEGEFLC